VGVGPASTVGIDDDRGAMPMTISATELRSFTTPGAQDAAARMYNAIKSHLESSPRLAGLDFELFLQGEPDSDVLAVRVLGGYMREGLPGGGLVGWRVALMLP
jgi:predicted transcriptional regulator YdeE